MAETNISDSQQVTKRSKSQRAIAQVVISAMMLAFAVVLKALAEVIPFLNFPNGGNVSVILVPLVLVSLFCGPIWGTFIGIAFGVIDFFWDGGAAMVGNSAAVVVCFFLDYFLAFGASGLGAIFRRPFFKRKAWAPVIAILVSGIARFLCSFFSGIIVWNNLWDYSADTAWQMDWSVGGVTYSLTYNLGYMLPTIALSILVVALMIRPLFTVMKEPIVKRLEPKGISEEEIKNSYQLPLDNVLLPIYLGVDAVLGIIAAIPYLKVYWLGYFGLVLSVALIAYLIYRLVVFGKKENPNWTADRKLLSLYLGLAVFCLGLSILGICSLYSYGAWCYSED